MKKTKLVPHKGKDDSLYLECQRLGADKTLSFGCILEFKEETRRKQLGPIFLYKYVRQNSSSSEGYDGYTLKHGQICTSDMRQGEFYFIVMRDRKSMYRAPDEESERINDELVDKYFDIIGHPITWGRLQYIFVNSDMKKLEKVYSDMSIHFFRNSTLYNQTILERDEETVRIVLSFLQSIGGTSPLNN